LSKQQTLRTRSNRFQNLPERWREERINDIAELRMSNVDKKSDEGEKSVKLCNYVDVYYNDSITSVINFMEATATEAQIERFTLRVGDVVITKDSESPDDIGIPSVITESIADLVCGYHLTILRPNEEFVFGNYLFYALVSRHSAYQFYLAANGVTRFGLTYQGTKNIRIAFPPIVEQQQISAFLDWKTGQIDALIAKKKELLEKLKERRLAVITQAVTKGLNPAAPLRDSGIPWLGQVPGHWEVKRLRFAVGRIEQGWSPQCDNQPADDEAWGVMKVGCVNGDEFDSLENKALPLDLEPMPEYELHPEDILISRANTKELLGSAAIVPDNVRTKLLLCDKLFRLRPATGVDAEFLTCYLRTPAARYQYEREATGSSGSMQNIGQSTIKNLVVVLPPLDEQKSIFQHIRSTVEKLDGLMQRTETAVARLTEYRAALITAATTGKIDVRQVVIPSLA